MSLAQIDWNADIDSLRKSLLRLSKSDLIKACKDRNVQYDSNRGTVVDRLVDSASISSTMQQAVPSSLKDRIGFYERKTSDARKRAGSNVRRRNKHGKDITVFSPDELEAVGLSWMKAGIKPPRLDIPESPQNVEWSGDRETLRIKEPHFEHLAIKDEQTGTDEQVVRGDTHLQHVIRPKTTQAISVPTPFIDFQNDEQNALELEYELEKKIQSYGSFEVMSSLMFGFAVSIVFEKVDSETFADADDSTWGYVLEVTFTVLIAVVLICNAYTMIVMSLTYFYVHRYMADREYIMAMIYLRLYVSYRRYGRKSFYIGLVCFLVAIGIYIFFQLRLWSKVSVVVFLGLGLLLIVVTLIRMTNPKHVADRNNPGHKKFLSAFVELDGVNEKTA